MREMVKFLYLFWFCVGIVSFAAGFTVFLIIFLPPEAAQRVADTAIIFWLSTGVSGVMGYLIGGAVRNDKTKGNGGGEGATTAEFTASVTTEPINKPEPGA